MRRSTSVTSGGCCRNSSQGALAVAGLGRSPGSRRAPPAATPGPRGRSRGPRTTSTRMGRVPAPRSRRHLHRARWCPRSGPPSTERLPPICGGPLAACPAAPARPCARGRRRPAAPVHAHAVVGHRQRDRSRGSIRQAQLDPARAGVAVGVGHRLVGDAQQVRRHQRRQRRAARPSTFSSTAVPPDSRSTSVCSAGTSPRLDGLRPQHPDRPARLLQALLHHLLGGLQVAADLGVLAGCRRSASSASSRHSSCTEVATNAWARVSWMSRAMRVRSAITACSAARVRASRRRWTPAAAASPAAPAAPPAAAGTPATGETAAAPRRPGAARRRRPAARRACAPGSPAGSSPGVSRAWCKVRLGAELHPLGVALPQPVAVRRACRAGSKLSAEKLTSRSCRRAGHRPASARRAGRSRWPPSRSCSMATARGAGAGAAGRPPPRPPLVANHSRPCRP